MKYKNRQVFFSLLNNLVVIFFVILWTIPTFGLLISSFRDKEQLSNSGWWTAFASSASNIKVATGSAGDQLEENNRFVIRGNLLETSGEVLRFGTSVREPAKFEVGEKVAVSEDETLVVQANGDYEYASTKRFEREYGRNVYLSVTVPPRFTLENYVEVLSTEGVLQSFINSLTTTIPATVIPIMVAAFCAYALAWMRFPFKYLILCTIIGLLVVPLQMSLIPVLSMYTEVASMFDTVGKGYLGVWLAHTGFGLPLAIYLLYNYMSSIPGDIIEVASIDGADHFQIFTKIMMPLCIPALASFGIFQFLWVWNDLLVALVFLGKSADQIVLTSKLRELLGSRGGNWEILTASAFVTIAVPLAVFLGLQRYFVRGLLAGSVK